MPIVYFNSKSSLIEFTNSEMSRDECRKYLRFLELDAYAKMVSVLRAQGSLTDEKQKLLEEIANALHISKDRHQAEIRRAVNDDKLTLVAEQLFGPNTDSEWTVEGRRIVPLFSRLKGRTAFTTFANSISLTTAIANERQPHLVKKKEVKYKNESRSPIKYDEKSSNSDSKNIFATRKRKRSTQEVLGLSNGRNSKTHTSFIQTNMKQPCKPEIILTTLPVSDQSFANKQNEEHNLLDECQSHRSKEYQIMF